jgi:hypothetical protein
VELSQNAGDSPSVQTPLYIARRDADETKMAATTTPQVQRRRHVGSLENNYILPLSEIWPYFHNI